MSQGMSQGRSGSKTHAACASSAPGPNHTNCLKTPWELPATHQGYDAACASAACASAALGPELHQSLGLCHPALPKTGLGTSWNIPEPHLENGVACV